MVMLTKNLKEILAMTREHELEMVRQLDKCLDGQRSTRNQMLLEYLKRQHQLNVELVEQYIQQFSEKALETWFYEYSDRHQVIHGDSEFPTDTMTEVDEILDTIAEKNNAVLDLFQHLHARTETHEVTAAVDQILESLEPRFRTETFEANRINSI